MFCSKCGTQLGGTATFCSGCGNPVGTPVAQSYSAPAATANYNSNNFGAPQYGNQAFNSPNYSAVGSTSGMAIGGFICSLLGISIIGLILGYLARKEILQSNGAKSGSGLATAAIVLGWLWLILSVVFGIIWGVALANASSSYYL